MWDAKMKCTDMQNDVIKFNCLRYSFFSIQEECSMPAFHWICCVAFDFSDSNCIFSIEQRKQRIISSRKTNELPLQFSNILFQAHFKWAISIVIKCKFDWPNDVTLPGIRLRQFKLHKYHSNKMGIHFDALMVNWLREADIDWIWRVWR